MRPPAWLTAPVSSGPRARWSVGLAAALTAAVELAFVAIDTQSSPERAWLRVAHAGLATATVVLLIVSPRAGSRAAGWSFVLVALPLFAVFWMDEAERAAIDGLWAPFVGPKLTVFAIALLSPLRPWISALLIAAFAGEAALLAFEHGLAGAPDLVHGEPWITLVYAGVALAVLVDRARAALALRAYERARAEKAAMQRAARVLLAARDLANTPLSTLELNMFLLRRRGADVDASLERMDRAIGRLRELRDLLNAYRSQTEWAPGDERFDPARVLEEHAGTERVAREPPARSRPGRRPRRRRAVARGR